METYGLLVITIFNGGSMARSHILKGFSDLESALWVHKYHPGLTIRQMVRTALENGYSITDTARYEAVQLLSEWELADGKSRSLTPEGEAFYSLWETKRSVAIDFLHGRQYGLWTQKAPDQNIASWAYKNICDYLWERQTLPDREQDLVAYINDLRTSDEVVIPPDSGNAFSNKSINDAYDWLLPLDPPVLSSSEAGGNSIRDATFSQRTFCSTSLFLMALSYIVREYDTTFGALVKIDDTQKQVACRFCLINETSFDLMLDEALRRVSYLSVQRGWDGIYIVLNQRPEIRDFIE